MAAAGKSGGIWRRTLERWRRRGRASAICRQALDWADEQDRWRELEQRHFAHERVRLELESLYALPSFTRQERA
jgi:hypothetical protein